MAESGIEDPGVLPEAAIVAATSAEMRAPCRNAMTVASSSVKIAGTNHWRTRMNTPKPIAWNIGIFEEHKVG